MDHGLEKQNFGSIKNMNIIIQLILKMGKIMLNIVIYEVDRVREQY